ncbi:hypothetical protein V493_02063 [Pseudogymnoascus sp. VKM F-4281 (FW-2241)]|nr:hypothetical protein V493_02063 [Pseudogymnoascus sp. VKM F-4281 (FW-2241)]
MRKQDLSPLGLALALLATLTLLITTTSAKCAAGNFIACESGFPSDFCCPFGTDCITLASNTTLLCCPSGMSCDAIAPIVCGIENQNATLHPESTIKTTNLLGRLGTCGVDKCCPFGYLCNGSGESSICAKELDQRLLPPPSSPPTSPASITTPSATSATSAPSEVSTSTSLQETPTAISPLNVSPTPLTATCPRFPTTAIITGLLPGIFTGILLSLLTFCLLGARRRRAESRAPKISSPTYQGSDFRTDFVRRYQSSSPNTSSGSPTTGIGRVRSLFRKSSSAAGGRQMRGLGMGLPSSPPPRRVVPEMPDHDLSSYRQELPAESQARELNAGTHLRREPSSESINIFADPSTARSGGLGVEERRQSAQTTFTDMMERADLKGVGQGKPYVPGMPSRLGGEEGTRLSQARFSPENRMESPRR